MGSELMVNMVNLLSYPEHERAYAHVRARAG
jgi:hypothetical protein